MRRIRVTCEECKYRHLLERPITAPQKTHIVCHECELVLGVTITKEDVDWLKRGEKQ